MTQIEDPRPPLPPFDAESAARKVRLAEDAWNTRDPQRVALAYTPDSVWRNRSEFISGRQEIVQFLMRKWSRELDYRLIKELWVCGGNRIAVRFAYEWHDDSGSWFRSYGNENWEFDERGFMRRRIASINDLPIRESDRKYHWPVGRRPDDHPGLSDLGAAPGVDILSTWLGNAYEEKSGTSMATPVPFCGGGMFSCQVKVMLGSGWKQGVWARATLEAGPEALTLRAWLRGTLSFAPEDVVALTRGDRGGVIVDHQKDEYIRDVRVDGLRMDPETLVGEIRKSGFVPTGRRVDRCFECGAELSEACDACPSCGWSWNSQSDTHG